MELEFKPDFEDARRRWDEFWAGRSEAPLLAAVVPRPGADPVPAPPYASGAEGHAEAVAEQVARWAETHEFLGAAIPFYYLEFAADHFAALLGADLVFQEGQRGGWAVPCLDDLDGEIRFRPESKWWERTVRLARALRRRGDGRFLIASNTLVANLDALAALRGTQRLLLDLVEDPEGVRGALEAITRAHREVLDALAELLDYAAFGSINRHGMYCRGRINLPQCDFSCMIGPDMFREFAVPYLRREMEAFDAVEYHLDGPGALQHLEALCEMERLEIIQWIPGTGNPEKQDWTWLYRRIDELGKGQIRFGLREGVAGLWRQTRSRKLFVSAGVRTRDEFERLTVAGGGKGDVPSN